MIRRPAVAGHFYQGSSESLKKQVERYIVPQSEKTTALGILSPHAGLMYSGSVAGALYSRLELPDSFILIGPNHTGLGAPVSIMASGEWETPLGTIEVDEPLARSLISISRRIQDDSLAHLREHSLEVQLPFIQYFKPWFKIVPIQMLDTRLETCQEVGKAVAEVIRDRARASGAEGKAPGRKESPSYDVLIVASSDMSHYVPADIAKEKDHKAIKKMLDLDPEGLYLTVKNLGISMCGFGPATAMLVACKELGANTAELIRYTNSGEVSGDLDQVVGYAGIIIGVQ